MLYVSQYGDRYYVTSVKELCEELGYSAKSARRMFRDNKDGSTAHVGYVIGKLWLDAYLLYEGRA